MKRLIGVLAIAAGLTLSTGANAALLFSDSLQGSLATPNFTSNASGQIVAAPVGTGNALNFAALGSGGDLFTQIISGTGTGLYRLTVDYYCGTQGGCGAFVGLAPGGQIATTPATQLTDNWLATDTPAAYPAPFLLTSTDAAGFTTNSFDFSVSNGVAFGLKLEDFSGAAGDAYFRNLSLSAVPEPATWLMMIGGFGLMGGALRRRRSTLVFA